MAWLEYWKYNTWYMIYKDAVSNPCSFATWNDVIHSKQVWVSWYKFPRDDGIMPTLTVNIDIVSTSCGIAQKTIGSATRYEFKGMYSIGMINER